MDSGGGGAFNATAAASNPTGLGAGAKPKSSASYAGNSGKNTVGYAKDGKSGDWDIGRGRDQAGSGVGKGRKKPLYGYASGGPNRSKIPSGNKEPKKGKKLSVSTEEAQPDKSTAANKKRKINRKTSDIATTGKLSHNRVGVEQKLSSWGSHRRSLNWIQPGVAKAQLIGPFSDHLSFNQKRPMIT